MMPRGREPMMRGPSVRDRASRYIAEASQASPGSTSMLTTPTRMYDRNPSTSPTPGPRMGYQYPQQQAQGGSSAVQNHDFQAGSPYTPPNQGQGGPGAGGAAKRMIQQWESSSPYGQGQGGSDPRAGAQQMNRAYLDHKPLPSPLGAPPAMSTTTPQHTPPGPSRFAQSPLRQTQIPEPGPSRPYPVSPSHQPQRSPIRGPAGGYAHSPGQGMQPSPSRVQFAPSPNKHLKTPNRGRSGSVDGSPPNWSGSPSEKKRKGNGKSPLKEMFNAIGKRAKGKGKEKRESYGQGGYDITMDGGLKRVGSNGLPGGIVFRDRMGDQEMDEREIDQRGQIVRFSPVLYLVPTPCSSVSSWGSWLTSWGVLTDTSLRLTFCPIFKEPQRQGSPRRMLDPQAPIPYHIIPAPDPNQRADAELDMRDCVEVRSLRREEVHGRGVPMPPEGVGTEVLEMVWSDGSRRYVGVEGVGGRISWISAIWDVLLACKPEGEPLLPPPSPTGTPRPLPTPQINSTPAGHSGLHNRPIDEPSPFRQYNDNIPNEPSPLRLYERRESDGTAIEMRKGSAGPSVQKVGDRWVAASAMGPGGSEISPTVPQRTGDPEMLRDSVKRMFDTPNPDQDDQEPQSNERTRLFMATTNGVHEYEEDSDGGDQTIEPPRIRSPSINGTPMQFDSNATLGMGNKASREATERILAWQPATERELSIFARSPSRASSRSQSRRKVLSDTDRDNSFKTADTEVSEDPSDLNPSRSASQVGRPRETPRRRGSKATTVLPPVDENVPPIAAIETSFSPMAEKAFKRMSRNDVSEEKSPRTPTKSIKELKSPRVAESGLSPMAERAYRQLAGKNVENDMDVDDQASHTASNRRNEKRNSGLPKSVEMISAENGSSETGESATLKTPHTDHRHSSRPSPRTEANDEDGDVIMRDGQGQTGSGGALSKLLPAYSDLSHSELGITRPGDEKPKSALDQVNVASKDLQKVIACLTTLVGASKSLEDPATLPKGLNDRFDTIQLDVKAIENALNISALRLPPNSPKPDDGKSNQGLVDATEMHARLDAIQQLCEEVLARQEQPIQASQSNKSVKQKTPMGLGLSLNADEQSAGDEVAHIMAELTGGSNGGTSPRRGGLQVLHNVSAPTSPRPDSEASPAMSQEPLNEDVKKQVVEVLGLVKELKEARMLQTQQTTDIARYLNELNVWLEKFVQNSAVELSSMSKRLNTLVGPKDDSDPDDPNGENSARVPLPDLVAEVHSMLAEQKKRTEEEGPVGQRLDGLLTMMGQDRERHADQQGMVEQVLAILGRQRNDNEMLLRALANDLTSEIRGERIRFVEAMQQATTMNVTRHVEEFKKTLSAEVQKSIKELGKMREEKRALEHQIADLFALKAKFGGESRRGSVNPPAGGGNGGSGGGGGGGAWHGGNIIQAMAAAANPANGYGGGPGGMGAMPGMMAQGGRALPPPPG